MDETPLRKIMQTLGLFHPQRSRDYLNCPCPFAPWKHPGGRDRHPSFGCRVVPGGVSSYKCYSCKSAGRISGLIRSLEHFREETYPGLALEADIADMTSDFGDFERPDMLGNTYEEYFEPLEEAAYGDIYPEAYSIPMARQYLQSRGISELTARTLELRWDGNEARVLFTVRNAEGGLLGWSGRSVLAEGQYPYNTYPKVRDYQGLPKRSILLGAHRLQTDRPLVIVEGLFGYANLVEQGVPSIANVVALLGSELTPAKEHLIKLWNLPAYLMVDNDEGGECCLWGERDPFGQHTQRGMVSKLYGHVPLYIPDWPRWATDVNHNGKWIAAGTPKTDPDELTFGDMEHILYHCLPWSNGQF